MISFEVTAKLICVFAFAYADCSFSHEAAQMIELICSKSVAKCLNFALKIRSKKDLKCQVKNEKFGIAYHLSLCRRKPTIWVSDQV